MADRYWVGGTASWDGTAGTKWSDTSGGAGGQAIPTSADDVFFDANSTGTVTIATGNTGAKSINCTGFTGTITGSANISVAGNITLVSGQTYTHTGTVTITGTSTLITAGKSFSGLTIDGTGITATLGDALNIGSPRSLTVTKGTFTTANFNLTASNLFSSSTNVRTIDLGSSTCSFGQINFGAGTNLTFNAGTSQVNFATPNATITSSVTYYNVSVGDGQNNSHVINGTNTFNNLTFVNRSGLGTNRVSLGGNQTITGTLTINSGASSISRRFYFYSSVGGTNRTLTAAAINIKNTDFRNITGAGAASWDDSSRTNYWGDAGGNSGITFAAGRNTYWNLSGTQNWTATAWALTNNGTPNANNYPLIQDTATFTEAGSVGTVALDTQGLTIGNITMADGVSNRTSAMTLNFGGFDRDWIFGSITFFSNLTISGGGANRKFTVCGYNNTQDITMAGKILPINFVIEEGYLNTVRLQDAFSTSRTLTLTLGTFNANNYNVTCLIFTSTNSNVRTLTMGSGLWTVTGTGTLWNTSTITNLTFNKDTADILFTDTSTTARLFNGGQLTFNKFTIGGATGTSTLTMLGAIGFSEIASTKTVAHTIVFDTPFVTSRTVGTWSVTGTSGNVVTVRSNAAGVRRTFTLTNVTSGIDYLSVKDIGINDADRFYVGANSIDDGNNLNVIFTASPAVGQSSNYFLLF